METDKPHVVRQGHPAQRLIVFIPVESLDDGTDVDAQVAVRQDNAFRVAGRARGILDKADIVGLRVVHLAVRARLHIAHQHCVLVEQRADGRELLVFREVVQSLQQVHLGKQGRPVQLRQDAKQLELMLITDTDGDGHRHDAAQYGSPEGDDEALIRFAENDQLVAVLHAARLQGPEQRMRSFPQFGKRDDGLVVLAIYETNLAFEAFHFREQVDQGVIEFH